MLYTGLDVHKKTIYATMMDKEGKIIEQKEFVNCKEELNAFLAGRPSKVVLEACGFWMPTYDLLKAEGYDVILAHPMRIKAIASAKLKTDKIDSAILADLLRANLIAEAYAATPAVREHKDLIRFRGNLVRTRTMMKNRIKAVLLKKGLVYRQAIFKGKTKEAYTKADPMIASYFAVIDTLNIQITQADKRIASLNTEDPDAELLKSIYGISDYAARTILSEIGNIKRFPSAKQLKSYAGLTPSLHQSGQTLRHGGITRQGSKWLRWILVQCVHVAVRQKDSRLGKFYARLCKRKKKQVAAVATANKLLEIIYAMLRDKKPYTVL
jgi:transposase